MRIEYLAEFNNDLDNISQRTVKKSVARIIHSVETAASLNEIANLKKLVGYKNAFRIRVGNYRIGIFLDGQLVQFARIVHRKEIYDVFP